jgi:hypothetical protein
MAFKLRVEVQDVLNIEGEFLGNDVTIYQEDYTNKPPREVVYNQFRNVGSYKNAQELGYAYCAQYGECAYLVDSDIIEEDEENYYG